MKHITTERGFTIIELLTVIAIIGILTSIVLMSGSEVRKHSRDKARIADIEQLALMMRLYVEQYGPEINCDRGFKIDGSAATVVSIPNGSCVDGGQILQFLEDQMGSVPHDPSGPNDGDNWYYLDEHFCIDADSSGDESGDPQSILLYAVNMETGKDNKLDVCDYDFGADGGYQDGATYVKRLDFAVSN